MTAPAMPATAFQGGRPRDPRLDFFRGAGMFIILLAHVPSNPWALWIPARFGFSDATEIFVFCSGMASAYAFAPLFAQRGLALGSARILFRVWQVYWAHIGVFVFTVALLSLIDLQGWGLPGKRHVEEPMVVPFLDRTPELLPALLGLRYVPGLFDILPMYLVILVLIPVAMALHRAGGPAAVAALVVLLWGAANLGFTDLPALPGTDAVWFFNPFGWQLVFFTGFAFGTGWLAPPPVSRRLVRLAVLVLVLSVPFAWFRLHEGLYLAPGGWLHLALAEGRALLEPLHGKTPFGALRFIHFLALAYLAWIAAGQQGIRLSAPLPLAPPARRRALGGGAALLLLATAPYAQIATIEAIWPALNVWALANLPLVADGRIGLLHLLHFAAALGLVWSVMPAAWLVWLAGPAWAWTVRVTRKVGTQSLAVFMVSIPLSVVCGLALDLIGRGRLSVLAVNLAGFAILAVTAYVCAWIKGHPWRRPVHGHRSMAVRGAAPAE